MLNRVLNTLLGMGSLIYYVRNIFRKTNISDPLIRTRTCVYQGVKNVSFWEKLAYLINEWPIYTNYSRHQLFKRKKSFSRILNDRISDKKKIITWVLTLSTILFARFTTSCNFSLRFYKWSVDKYGGQRVWDLKILLALDLQLY